MCSQLAAYEQNSKTAVTRSRSSTIDEELKDLKLRNGAANTKAKQHENLDFDSALEQITHLKSHVESMAKDLNISFNFNGNKNISIEINWSQSWAVCWTFQDIWLQQNGTSSEHKQRLAELESSNEKLKSDNQHLRDEYEKYKIRTNYLIKSAKQQQQQQQQASLQSQQSGEDLQELQAQCHKLRDECDTLRKRVVFVEKEKRDEAESLGKHSLSKQSDLRNEFKAEMERVHAEHAKLCADLERELVKQRDRTVK
jgi:hypothetical protein